jgi:hypothetical protein
MGSSSRTSDGLEPNSIGDVGSLAQHASVTNRRSADAQEIDRPLCEANAVELLAAASRRTFRRFKVQTHPSGCATERHVPYESRLELARRSRFQPRASREPDPFPRSGRPSNTLGANATSMLAPRRSRRCCGPSSSQVLKFRFTFPRMIASSLCSDLKTPSVQRAGQRRDGSLYHAGAAVEMSRW